MKVLLTGGTGYVGRALRALLLERGHRVRLLVRNKIPLKDIQDPRIDAVNGNVLDTNACLRAVDGCGAVINLVGIIREFPKRGITFDSLHTEATANLVKAALHIGVTRFLQMSALGTRSGAVSRYHRTKFAAEEILRGSGLRWTIFRPSLIFHPGDEFTREMAGLARRRLVPFVDGGKALLQPVSRANVVGPFADALRMPETHYRVFEMGGPERIAFGELIREIASYYGIGVKPVPVPSRFLRPVVKVMQRFESFPLTADQLAMLIEDNVCDTAEFTKVFNIAELDSFRAALPSLLEAARPSS